MAALVASVILLFAGIFALQNSHQAVDFYSSSLAQAQVEEVVTIGTHTYHVANGSVYTSNAKITGGAALPALKLAYEVTLARRDPLFALPGTDPIALQNAALGLDPIETRLAALQKNAADAALMRHLYPTDFLRSASALEAARQALITAPTLEAARRYEQLLPHAMREKERALKDFASAFAVATKDSTVRVGLLGGILSSTTVRVALTEFINNLPDEQTAVVQRTRCMAGIVRDCNPLPPAITAIHATHTESNTSALTPEVLGLWDAAHGTPPLARTVLRLTHSVCLPKTGEPVDVLLSTRQGEMGSTTTLTYADDIFLYRLSALKKSPYATYMQETYGSQYSVLGPFKFYVCPDTAIDQGTAIATARTLLFAKAHPTIAPDARATLVGSTGYPSDSDAQQYVAHALADTTKTTLDEHHQLEELMLMLRAKTGGLEDIIDDIVAVMTVDTQEPLQAVNNVSVSYEFLTHSAFASFFRIGSSASATEPPLYEAGSAATVALEKQVVTYSALRTHVPRATIIHDLRSFLIAEGRFASTTPSIAPSIE